MTVSRKDPAVTPDPPVIAEHDVTVYLGDVRERLAELPARSVQCCVTSPPYYGLRDYGVDGQIGLEASPAEYVAEMVGVFREVRRVLADDGVLWLNLGDSYSAAASGPRTNWGRLEGKAQAINSPAGFGDKRGFLPEKNLMGIPWRVALALQDDDSQDAYEPRQTLPTSLCDLYGDSIEWRDIYPEHLPHFRLVKQNRWTLRNAVVWSKPNAMPESVTDRLSTRYEHVFLFSKSRRYWFDLDAIREPHAFADDDRVLPRASRGQIGAPDRARAGLHAVGRNPGDVWEIATQPFPGAHFATMPPALARRCILAGCPEGATVLDPFTGSGTTAMVARQLGRRFVGVELNPDYIPIIRDRIGQEPFDFGEVSA